MNKPNKFAIIPTRKDSIIDTSLVDFLDEAGWYVYLAEDSETIFDAFESSIEYLEIEDDHDVILCHDDIEILNNAKVFNEILEVFLDKANLGFVGVAGTKTLDKTGVWWSELNNPECRDRFSGLVWHGSNYHDMQPSNYGLANQPVVTLDGLFLAAKGRTLKAIDMKKPTDFEGGWDYYDILYCMRAIELGLINATCNLQILHKSVGDVSGRESWHKNREAFLEAYAEKLPLVIK